MRFFIPALVHLPVNRQYMTCAFTMKIHKLCEMLISLGHEVILLGAEGSDAACTEFVQTHTLADLRKQWGDGDNRFDLGYDWQRKSFRHDFNSPKTATTQKFYAACIEAINARKRPDDFLLLMQGVYHKPIADAVKVYLTCEPGIGYRGSFCRFRAFESAYLQNFTYGSEHPRESINGNWYDRVIPNYFDLRDFDYGQTPGDYFLYIGRLIQRKGIQIASQTTAAIGATLKLAGQGCRSWDPDTGTLTAEDCTITGKHLDYVGYADVAARRKLLAGARGVFVPTLYMEAFGGTNVEAQLSGTPAITTDFGVFPETVEHGSTGYRCNTLQDFVDAAGKVGALDRQYIRDRATARYSMDTVKLAFAVWFRDLYQLYLSSTDAKIKGWHHLRALATIVLLAVLASTGCRTGVVVRDCSNCSVNITSDAQQGKATPFDVARGAKLSGLPGGIP